MLNPSSSRLAAFAPLHLVLILGGLAGPPAGALQGMEVVFEHDGDPVYRVLPPGQIPAIDKPQFVRGDEADQQMSPNEPIFGLIMNDEARAYSLWQLDRHEIVNDSMGRTAFAATW